MQIDFDPKKISYELLLDIFWQSHDPSLHPGSGQYKKAVFYHNDKQKLSAEQTKKHIEENRKKTIKTHILALTDFYRAEDYHQKYMLRSQPEFLSTMTRLYPDSKSFTDATATARLNGYLGGHGNSEQLLNEIDSLGLDSKQQTFLKKIMQRK